jgi:DNA-binding NtrC family response regulator
MADNRVLIVDDDKSILTALRMILEGHYEICTAMSATEALESVRECEPTLILLDIGLPDMNGIDLLEEIKRTAPETIVIMATAVEETRMVVKALKLGAFDYLVKPIDAQELKTTLQNALENRSLKDKIRRIQKPNVERYRFDLIGKSPKALAMLEIATKAARSTDTPVLIVGETGTGKGVLARAIHYSYSDLPGPFVTVNCTAITHDLFESELFGYDRGAFTGAKSQGKMGRFEEAEGGTLFLDEIGSMSLATQSKLLGVLEDRTFYRVGGNRTYRFSSRVIAATNTEIEKAVEDGLFRKDLFFRLNVVRIDVPPLRERVEDIPLLVEHFMGYYNHKFRKNFNGVSPEAEKMLFEYSWPGNVRELRNTLERIILLENGPSILPDHLSFIPADQTAVEHPEKSFPEDALDYQEASKRLLLEALTKSGGNVLEAARLLNIPAHKVRYRVKKYGIKYPL